VVVHFDFPLEDRTLSRIVKPESAGKDRTRLTKAIVIAIRELGKKSKPDDEAYDLAAFVVLALNMIASTIDESVKAWEKRGYWVKADRFRLDWVWAQPLSEQLGKAILNEDWRGVINLTVNVMSKLGNVSISTNHRMGKPWVGAWEQFKSSRL
jgi:hypothetical protein